MLKVQDGSDVILSFEKRITHFGNPKPQTGVERNRTGLSRQGERRVDNAITSSKDIVIGAYNTPTMPPRIA